MTECILGYITTPNIEEAKQIAKELLLDKLIACANIYPKVYSLFWWKGEIDKSEETILIVKSKRNLKQKIVEKVCSMHSYECPCIIFLPIEDGAKPFLDWIISEVN